MKRKLAAFLILPLMSFVLTGCGGNSAADTGSDDGVMRKDFTAADCADAMGIGINLGNTFDAYWEDTSNKTAGAAVIGSDTPQDYETCWGAVVTSPEAIAGMKNAGFSTVRVPVYWGNMMEDDGTFTVSDTYLARVKEVVDYCRDEGLYTVVNMHHFDEFLVKNYSREEAVKAAGIVWEQVASYFRDYSDYLVFEGYNEALGTGQNGAALSEDEAYGYVNEMNQVFVDTVRKTGGNNKERILIASGYWTNIDNTTKDKYVLPEDPAENKLMVSVHYIDNACYWTNNVGSQYWLDYSTQQCELLRQAFTEQGIPVFVGECTAHYEDERRIPGTAYEDSDDCLRTILNMAADYGFVPVLWDTSNNFYSRDNAEIILPEDRAVIAEISEKLAQ